ncbi:MAG: SGNH/GDSL hydrolase family protein [Verrucomicrobia bacterium]|nr:SGNH/GDSL hydrolase family protein [Verrucomicrobiota bacterium]
MKQINQSAILTTISLLSAAGLACATDVIDVNGVDPAYVADASYKLVGDTTFDYKWRGGAGGIDLNGHAFVSDTGGGNRRIIGGAITGTGTVAWSGGGVPQVDNSILSGDQPNTFKGTFTLLNGVLDLDKPAGVDAIPGDLIIGSKGNAMVKLMKSNQINDASNVTLGGPEISWLNLNGHDETIASLTVMAHAVIDMGGEPSALAIGDSSACQWDLTKTVTISGFKAGKNQLVFGKHAKGLTPEQLARVGFDDPAGMLYTANMDSNGQVTPAAPVKAVNPPFEVSPTAAKERAKFYEVPGLAALTDKHSPLKDGLTIGFFGDSITWQNGYVGMIGQAIKDGEGTKGMTIKLVNRGINGADAAGLLKGSQGGGYPGNTPQQSLADVLVADKVDLAVVFIGINDVWFGKGPADDYEKSLREMVATAKAAKTTLVLTTVTVQGELPDGKNGNDPKIEIFAEIARKVAKDTGTTLVDLRKAYIAYLQNHNAKLRIDGSLYLKPAGILTYDGVHPSATGNTLLANLIGDGIFRALSKQQVRGAE